MEEIAIMCAWRTSRNDGVVTALLVHQIVQFSGLTSPAKNCTNSPVVARVVIQPHALH